jgi:DNA-binding MarR family transcriptional regulator
MPERSDPVSRARQHWRKQQFGEDEGGFLAMTSVLRVHRMMSTAIEQELKPHDIKLNDYMLLMTLAMSDNGTRPIARLAASLLVHPTTATLAVDRLEARGLLARTPHPSDRRATLVTITETGRDLLSRATKAIEPLDYGLTGTTSEDRTDLVAVLDRVREAAGD